MLNLLEALTNRLTTQRKFRQTAERLSRSYQCRCGTAIFFRNTQCLNCKSPLGYLPDTLSLVALNPGPDPDTVCPDGSDHLYKYCANRQTSALCNWLVEASDPNRSASPVASTERSLISTTPTMLATGARSKRRSAASSPNCSPSDFP